MPPLTVLHPRVRRPTVNQWCSSFHVGHGGGQVQHGEKGQAGQSGLPTGTGTLTRQHEGMPSSGSGLLTFILNLRWRKVKDITQDRKVAPISLPLISSACSGPYLSSISGLGLAWDCKVRRCFPQVAVLRRTPSFFIHNWCNGYFCLSPSSYKTSGYEEQYCSILSWNHPGFLQVKHVQVSG